MSWGRRRRGSYGGYFQRRPKVDLARIKKENPNIKPIVIEGRTISRTFWGKGWCDHFEGMADFDNRLPRGRTYARNGSVFHLEIGPGSIVANVAGSDVYTVKMEVDPLPLESWGAIIQKCHGRISTIIDLLKGQFSPEVMEVVCDPKNGLFPTAKEIRYNCSCPDWAHLCKHIAAIFYGIGNRLDTEPELLFLLRRVNPNELLASGAESLLDGSAPDNGNVLNGDLGAIFGIELTTPQPVATSPMNSAKEPAKRAEETKPPRTKRLSDPLLTEAIAQIGQSRRALEERSSAEPPTRGRMTKGEITRPSAAIQAAAEKAAIDKAAAEKAAMDKAAAEKAAMDKAAAEKAAMDKAAMDKDAAKKAALETKRNKATETPPTRRGRKPKVEAPGLSAAILAATEKVVAENAVQKRATMVGRRDEAAGPQPKKRGRPPKAMAAPTSVPAGKAPRTKDQESPGAKGREPGKALTGHEYTQALDEVRDWLRAMYKPQVTGKTDGKITVPGSSAKAAVGPAAAKSLAAKDGAAKTPNPIKKAGNGRRMGDQGPAKPTVAKRPGLVITLKNRN